MLCVQETLASSFHVGTILAARGNPPKGFPPSFANLRVFSCGNPPNRFRIHLWHIPVESQAINGKVIGVPATLTWLDHDASDRDRMNRILALFRERDTRDELGVGVIRDLLADELFPGTSTIQTRLRYMLFVPWIYKQLEEGEWGSDDLSREARKREVALVKVLSESDDTDGVFGKRAGGDLKRLPSSVYWAGLGLWQIRRFEGSQEQYNAAIDDIYELRKTRHRVSEMARRRGEGSDATNGVSAVTWHSKLPAPPPDFPDGVGIALTQDEAHFIQDQIITSQPKSLLARVVMVP